MRIISMSHVMLCWPQKSSISCVSGRPPMSEPEKERRRKISGNAATGSGFLGRADQHQVAVALQQVEVGVDVVRGGHGIQDEIEAAGLRRHLGLVLGDDHLVGAEAFGVATLPGDVVNSTTWAPKARANLTPMWPRPPRPTMPTFWPGPTFQWRSGE
jgi:hypothetical protein